MSSTQPNDNRKINPQLLRQASWLLHRNKKPFYITGTPRRGPLDTPKDLARLAAYDAAVAALGNGGKFTGLGFAVNQGYQFIDLDKCRNPDTGVAAAWTKPIIAKAKKLGAYIEVSISGTGLHIVGYGEEFPTFRGSHVELYDHGRYMAMGRKVLHTGTDPLPDLGPLLPLMDIERAPPRPKPALRLVSNRAPLTWHEDAARIPGLLAKLDPDMEYPNWRDVGMAIHDACAGSEEGLLLWDTWSSEGVKYEEEKCERLWRGFRPGGGITMGSLVHMVQEADDAISSPVIDSTSIRRKEFSDDELMTTQHAPIPWIVDQLICPGLTLLAAPPKMGKSYLVLQMALCVGAGKPFLGRDTRQVKVSYFDLEEWEELLQTRRKRIGTGHRITKTKVRYAMELSGGKITVLQDIQRHVDEGAELVIIDLLARIRDELTEDAKKNAYARDYAALRKFADMVLNRNPHVAIVMVHHTNKGNHDDWQNKISGSQGLAGATHTNMLMTTIDLRGLDDEGRKEALSYRRLHVVGKAVAADEMMLVQMENGGGWEVSDKSTDEVKMQSKRAHILQVLREANGAWMTAKEVHAQVDGTLDSVKKQLLRMAKKGEIQSSGSGGAGYRLAQ